MQVHRNTGELPQFSNAVITIGTFDGVHTGHRKILAAVISKAIAINGESILITFDPHPRRIVQPQEPMQLINTLDEKIRLLSQCGIDHLVIIPFTPIFADLPAEEYIRDFLVRLFRPACIIIGYDHHFGRGREGNFRLLEQKSSIYHYQLMEIPGHVLDEIAVSSTKIRKAIMNSDIETANRLLGYPFFFEGMVIHGDKLGRKLGFPTANLHYTDPEKIRLGHGVYAVYAEIESRRMKAMLSIGTRPTVADTGEQVEVHIFDLDRELYGSMIRIYVKKFLRAQEKFRTPGQLSEQMEKDRQASLEVL